METGDPDRFWYRNNTGSGYEFVMVNPAAGSREPLFDPLPLGRSDVARRLPPHRTDEVVVRDPGG